ncbi:MAG: hypothetical protein ABIQ35_01195 [Verrucomicrobiota bacterium]
MSPKLQQLMDSKQTPGEWSSLEVFCVLGASLLIMALLFIWAAYFRRSKRRTNSRTLGTDHLPKPLLSNLRERKRKRRRRWKNRNPTLSQTGGLPPSKDGDALSDPG